MKALSGTITFASVIEMRTEYDLLDALWQARRRDQIPVMQTSHNADDTYSWQFDMRFPIEEAEQTDGWFADVTIRKPGVSGSVSKHDCDHDTPESGCTNLVAVTWPDSAPVEG